MNKPLQVYLVEDSQFLQSFLTSSIAEAGAEVCGRSSKAEEAIEDIFALNPDVVLIDISLQSGSGFDVLKVLKEQNLAPDAVKVVLTNHPEYREVCALLGADQFFDKSMETAQALAFIGAMVVQGHNAGRMIPIAQPTPV